MDVDELWNLVLPRLERIEAKADATNGRLRRLEEWRHYVDGARAATSGAFHVWVALAGVVLSLGGAGAAWVAIVTRG
jgi:hypothetical protein